MRLHLDFETFSAVDIGVGTFAYAAHPSTEALMLGYAADSNPVKVWDIACSPPMPSDLARQLEAAEEIWAYNAQFERIILLTQLGIDIPLEKWRCCQALAYSLGFAGRLDDVLMRFNLTDRKDPEGRRLIRKFSMLQPKNRVQRRIRPMEDIIDWGSFIEYCKQDVEVERTLWRKCIRAGARVDWSQYRLDQEINQRGLPIDRVLVHQVLGAIHVEQARLMREMVGITQLENPNSVQQLGQWLADRGSPTPDLKAATVTRMIEDEVDPMVVEVLQLRQQLSKSSNSKWQTLADSAVGGRLRGAFQFLGAGRTGRFAGRQFQPHNLPRPVVNGDQAADVLLGGGITMVDLIYDRPMDVYSSLLRSALTAPDGKLLVVSDLSSIESRLAGWVCRCKAINDIFAENRDVYKALAARLYEKDEADVTKEERFFAKPAALGAQYGLGWKGLRVYARDFGVDLDADTAQFQISMYRNIYPEVQSSWYQLGEAISEVLTDGGTAHACRCLWSRRGQFLVCQLPSGRGIHYYLPLLEDRYMGKNQRTQQWERIFTHGGKVLENIIQAVAFDVLIEWLTRLDRAGVELVGHVHDEVIALAPLFDADQTLETINEQVTVAPMPWGQDLLLGASGYVAKRYRKD
jgi:DNA polymerase